MAEINPNLGDRGRMPKDISDALFERFASDPYAHRLGFEIHEVKPGYAQVSVTVSAETLNFAGAPHGGFLFSLADYAFALASNAHGRLAVATSISMQFYAAAKEGERLIAQATETHLTHRVGYYEMTVATDGGALVAKCLGMVHRTSRDWNSAGEEGGDGRT